MYDGETITRPVIYTDSIALKWMETASMYGTLTVVEGQPVITIYTDKNKNSGKGEKERNMKFIIEQSAYSGVLKIAGKVA